MNKTMIQEQDKVLRLTIKKKWFDMIASGEKKEEYREIKKHWIDRLVIDEYRKHNIKVDVWDLIADFKGEPLFYAISKEFKFVEFVNGYSKNAERFTVYCKGIEIGNAKPEWSDNWKGDVFIIKLGSAVVS